MTPKSPIKYATYTRASEKERLKQEFNSLDAQREAVAEYQRRLMGEKSA